MFPNEGNWLAIALKTIAPMLDQFPEGNRQTNFKSLVAVQQVVIRHSHVGGIVATVNKTIPPMGKKT